MTGLATFLLDASSFVHKAWKWRKTEEKGVRGMGRVNRDEAGVHWERHRVNGRGFAPAGHTVTGDK